jgi:hypothetical protein
MTDFLNPAAELDHPDSGKLILPSKAYEIKSKNKFYCPDFDCKDKKRILVVKKSSIGNYFFSHRPKCEHNINETLLHKLAIEWFINKEKYEIPSYNEIKKQIVVLDKSKTICEFRLFEKIIPDVRLITINGFQFAIEIVLTNDINDIKVKLIEEFRLPTIRVDLTKFYDENKVLCQTDYNFIISHLPQLMGDIKLKRWVITPDIETIKEKLELNQTSSNDGCMVILVGFGIFLLIRKLFI